MWVPASPNLLLRWNPEPGTHSHLLLFQLLLSLAFSAWPLADLGVLVSASFLPCHLLLPLEATGFSHSTRLDY